MKNKINQLFRYFGKVLPTIYPIVGSFIVSFCWNWYHLDKKDTTKLGLYIIGTFLFIYLFFFLSRRVYTFLIKKYNKIDFWHKDFYKSLPEIFLVFSLFFLVFLLKNQILSLVYFLFVFTLLFFVLERHLKKHPTAFLWRTVNRTVFVFALFIFLIVFGLQLVAYDLYILDPYVRVFNVVLFRSLSIASFWLLGFAVCGLIYTGMKSKIKFLFLFLWSSFFIFFLFFWLVNIVFLYYDGFLISPMILNHLEGSSQLIFNRLSITLLVGFLALSFVFLFVLKFIKRAKQISPARYWNYYYISIIFISLFSLFAFSSLKNTPEFLVLKSFVYDYKNSRQEVVLDQGLQNKLEKFGLFYNTGKFKVAEKDLVYKNNQVLLPSKFKNNPPNVMIILFESFSARLTSVYNEDRAGVTPGLEKMASDPHTTIFKNYYNASSPTVTGIMSQLCSLLPPTGHTEIEGSNKFRGHRLLCLPEVLQNNKFKDSVYFTAVPKEFGHKGEIIGDMGVNRVYGQKELGDIITAEPLSWGYSDHQLFPVVFNTVKELKQPWLAMYSTVDNHPPYDLAEDMVYWGDGKNKVLNSVHTSDDAFSKFWDDFKKSKYYDNTIVVAVADHAIFHTVYSKEYFPKEAGKILGYDENMFMMYVPNSVLPKEVSVLSSGVDFTPTLLNVLGINAKNNFEGHSIFDDRENYPNILGMQENFFYINQKDGGERKINWAVPYDLDCGDEVDEGDVFTLCDYQKYYNWKRQMLEEGRFWK